MQARFDLIIYGATGFTGSIAVKNLMNSANLNGMRVAIAGRDRTKLEALRQLCSTQPDIIIADSTNVDSIDDMVKHTRVLLNFAGPFAKYAEPVIRACATMGTHYLDITGETAFIRSMMNKYQDTAKLSGARIIPFCGFDSVPADLTTSISLEVAAANQIRLEELCLYYQIKGGYNGGTLATAMNMAESKASTAMSDSNILIADESWPKEPADGWAPRYEPHFTRWSTSFFMSQINKAVVRRSAWLRSHTTTPSGAGQPDFHYQERMLMPSKYGFAHACITTAFLSGFGLLSSTSLGRQLIQWYCKQPGEGPSEKERLDGFVKVKLIGRSAGQDKVKISMDCQGDPGNEVTVAIANACARLAVENQFSTDVVGFLTPSVAFGKSLQERLESAGICFTIELMNSKLTGDERPLSQRHH